MYTSTDPAQTRVNKHGSNQLECEVEAGNPDFGNITWYRDEEKVSNLEGNFLISSNGKLLTIIHFSS